MFKFFLLVLLLSCITWQSALATQPIQVTVRPIAQLLLHPQEEAPAETKSLNDGLITAQVAGTILEIPIQVGQEVKAGETLVRLDPWVYRLAQQRSAAELEGLQAQLETARKREQRSLHLQQQKQATEELLEQRQTEVKTLTAQIKGVETALEEARVQIQKCLIQAPFAGVIVQRLARIGSNTAPGTPLIQLVDTHSLEISAPIATGRVDSLMQAKSWNFIHENRHYPLRLRTVTPYAEPISRTQEARLQFVDVKPVPGSAGRLVWEDPRPHLPPWTFVQRESQLGIFLVEDNKAVFHPLPGAIEGRPVPVGAQLRGELVLSGREGLIHGTTVKALPAP